MGAKASKRSRARCISSSVQPANEKTLMSNNQCIMSRPRPCSTEGKSQKKKRKKYNFPFSNKFIHSSSFHSFRVSLQINQSIVTPHTHHVLLHLHVSLLVRPHRSIDRSGEGEVDSIGSIDRSIDRLPVCLVGTHARTSSAKTSATGSLKRASRRRDSRTRCAHTSSAVWDPP